MFFLLKLNPHLTLNWRDCLCIHVFCSIFFLFSLFGNFAVFALHPCRECRATLQGNLKRTDLRPEGCSIYRKQLACCFLSDFRFFFFSCTVCVCGVVMGYIVILYTLPSTNNSIGILWYKRTVNIHSLCAFPVLWSRLFSVSNPFFFFFCLFTLMSCTLGIKSTACLQRDYV